MVESPVMSTEILQRPKKNVIFEEIATPRSVSTSISTPAVTSIFISTTKTTKTMKPVRQKLINEVRAKADFYGVILRILD